MRHPSKMDAMEGIPAIPDILCLLLANEHIQSPLQTTHALLCNPEARYFSPTPADVKWACGYKNFQVMVSCILSLPDEVSGYLKTRLRESLGGSLGPNGVPSISQLQKLIEHAWSAGFDIVRCSMLAYDQLYADNISGRISTTRRKTPRHVNVDRGHRRRGSLSLSWHSRTDFGFPTTLRSEE